MTTLLFAVGTGVLATGLWWLGTRVAHITRRMRLRRVFLGERRKARNLLAERLDAAEGLSSAQVRTLSESFRLQANSWLPALETDDQQILRMPHLIDYIEKHSGDALYLIRADSGYGKTVFANVLPLLRSSRTLRTLLPIYIDLAEAKSADPLAMLGGILDRLGAEREFWGRPLFVFDALNETVDPTHFAAELATRQANLAEMDAALLFLFSFRHRSYPGQLRSALTGKGFHNLSDFELLFDHGVSSDVAFMPELLSTNGSAPPTRAEIESDLRAYGQRHFSPPLSRADAAAYVDWRWSSPPAGPDRQSPPAPGSLRFAQTLAGVGERESLFEFARVAFFLLGAEVTAATYGEIQRQLGLDRGKLVESLASCGAARLARTDAQHLRFEDETTVRVLGAIEVARLLLAGESPPKLRGRTTYDVCAPFVQPALAWLCEGSAERDHLAKEGSAAILAALKGPTAPYSFYATVICADASGFLAEHLEALSNGLFEAMIIAIDEDRTQACEDSVRAAGRGELELVLDPVLDQLFEVMDAFGTAAVPLLIGALGHLESLPRSQAAYLLVAWVQRVAEAENPSDAALEVMASIPEQIPADEENLHVRFHLVEVLEQILRVIPDATHPAHRRASVLLKEIAANPGASGRLAGYVEFQELLCMRAARGSITEIGEQSELLERVRRVTALIDSEPSFACEEGEIGEEQLECWEVALAMAALVSGSVHRNSDLVSFIEGALEHRFWIVRWWAFNALIGVIRLAIANGDLILARRCARVLVGRLYLGVEPMGLKHRQCAEVSSLAGRKGELAQLIREALGEQTPPRAGTRAGQLLAESYYEMMGASPDEYLAEYFRRIDQIAPDPSSPVRT